VGRRARLHTGAAEVHPSSVAIAEGEYSEVIPLDHTKQLAAFIPGSTLILLPNLSHFAMWQDAEAFNAAVLKYLDMK